MNLCASIASYKRRRSRMRHDPPLTIIKILLCRSLAILSHVLLQAPPVLDTVVGYLKLICYKCMCRTHWALQLVLLTDTFYFHMFSNEL